MNDWVSHFAEEERERSRAHSRDAAALVGKIENARFHLRNLVDLLRAHAASDVEAFAAEFPERAVTFEENPDGGFTVRRGHYPEVKLTLEPNPDSGTVTVDYLFASETGTLTPKPRILELAGQTADRLHFRDDEGQHTFRTIPQLSEHLLVPVFTGRPR